MAGKVSFLFSVCFFFCLFVYVFIFGFFSFLLILRFFLGSSFPTTPQYSSTITVVAVPMICTTYIYTMNLMGQTPAHFCISTIFDVFCVLCFVASCGCSCEKQEEVSLARGACFPSRSASRVVMMPLGTATTAALHMRRRQSRPLYSSMHRLRRKFVVHLYDMYCMYEGAIDLVRGLINMKQGGSSSNYYG